MPANVDTSRPPAERVRACWTIAKQVVLDIDGQNVNDSNVMRFLLHVVWHEGAQLRYREQIGGGPGRSFSQFEPPAAKDALFYADQKNWLPIVAQALNQTAAAIRAEAQKLPNAGGWPAGGLVESWLIENDYFGSLLTRIALRKVPAPIGTSLAEHGEYWATYWKRVFASPDDRKARIKQFVDAAAVADSLVSATPV